MSWCVCTGHSGSAEKVQLGWKLTWREAVSFVWSSLGFDPTDSKWDGSIIWAESGVLNNQKVAFLFLILWYFCCCSAVWILTRWIVSQPIFAWFPSQIQDWLNFFCVQHVELNFYCWNVLAGLSLDLIWPPDLLLWSSSSLAVMLLVCFCKSDFSWVFLLNEFCW